MMRIKKINEKNSRNKAANKGLGCWELDQNSNRNLAFVQDYENITIAGQKAFEMQE